MHRRTVQKDLHDPDNHDGVITHLEPDILECEVKQALGSITMNKASGGDGIPAELFQILKDDIENRLQEYTEELYKEDLHDPHNHDGVITNLEPASWNVKSSGPQEASLQTKLEEVMEFQLSYFKSLKMML